MQGVALKDGTEFRAKRVVSGADANVTFIKLMDAKDLPADFRDADQPHRLQLRDGEDQRRPRPAAELQGAADVMGRSARSTTAPCTSARTRTTSSAPTTTPSTAAGRANPMLECTMATALDDTLAPPGKHILSMFVQYAAVPPEGHDLGRGEGQVRGPLLRHPGGVRPGLQVERAAPHGDPAAGHGAAVGHHRRQHHAGLDEPAQRCSASARRRATRTTARR